MVKSNSFKIITVAMLCILLVTSESTNSFALRPIASKSSTAGSQQDTNFLSQLTRRDFIKTLVLAYASYGLGISWPQQAIAKSQADKTTQSILAFLQSHSKVIDGNAMPYSFYIPFAKRQEVFQEITASYSDGFSASIERRMVDSMMNFYDVSCAQILSVYAASDDWFRNTADSLANVLECGYWGEMKLWSDDTRYFPMGDTISLVFRSTDGNGRWKAGDPYDGRTRQWEDWKPIAGENAWIALSLAHTHMKRQKMTGQLLRTTPELQQAERIANSLLLMQADNGGIRFAPKGTWYSDADTEKTFCWNEISTENNLSTYAAFRALYKITHNMKYLVAMRAIEKYFESVAIYDEKIGECYFAQGKHYYPTGKRGEGEWRLNTSHFATDCQTWAIACLGADKINEIFHKKFGKASLKKTAAFNVWCTTEKKAGQLRDGKLVGVAYTENQDVVSVEWTAGAIQAALILSDYYKGTLLERRLFNAAVSMRQYIEGMRISIDGSKSAYPYASERVYIPFGWWSPSSCVLSTTSSAWIGLLNSGIDPFQLEGKIPRAEELFAKIPSTQPASVYHEAPGRREKQPVAVLKTELIADAPSGTWSGWGAFSCYIDGNFDLTKYSTLRIAFSRNQAGTHFYVRLLPSDQTPDSQSGLNRKKYTIPDNGIVDISIKEFPINKGDLENIKQISIHSGKEAWGSRLGQGEDKRAIFTKIEALKSSSAGLLPAPTLHRIPRSSRIMQDFIPVFSGVVSLTSELKYTDTAFTAVSNSA